MIYTLVFLAGVLVGAGIAFLVLRAGRRAAQEQLRQTFAALATEALDANSRRLLDVLEGSGKRFTDAAAAQLDGKKALIDQSLTAVNERLEGVRQYLQGLEAQRRQDYGQLSSSVASLSQSAGQLHQMLASTQRRGAWGERMAEDVLRLAGMQENINYVKQSTEDAASGRADFTFLLPNDLKANMDVKFPLEKYKAYLDATSDPQRAACLHELCAAVRFHIRDVARRGYIDPKTPTVPYVIVFIPSEQIFSLVLGAEPDLIDESLALKVVLCSPLTLYAKLAIMRQTAENFNIMKTADEVISLLGAFNVQWQRFKESMDTVGKRLDDAKKEFDKLVTTRTNMLERPLAKIEELRTARGLPDGEEKEGTRQ
jgi:DNA recombination protein RmuC